MQTFGSISRGVASGVCYSVASVGFLQEAFDIFGDVGELLEIYDQRKREEAVGADEEQEPDFSDEEAAETFRVEQVLTCKLSTEGCHAPLSALCMLSASLQGRHPVYLHSLLVGTAQSVQSKLCQSPPVTIKSRAQKACCVWLV